MSISQKNTKTPLIDYIPAELRENKTWVITYSVYNPYTNILEPKKKRVKPLKSIVERRKLAKRMVSELNSRLKNGWNPFLEKKGVKELNRLYDVFDIYLRNTKKEYLDGNLSFDTWKTYRSKINNFKEWLQQNRYDQLFCYQLDHQLIDSFLDYLRYDRDVSARTRDNYMTFLTTFCLWMRSKKYIASNPCEDFKKIHRKKESSRLIFPKHIREIIINYWREHNHSYFVMCMTCYYCLVRRTELTKLRVRDLNLKEQTLFVEAENAKNNKTAHVTIPKELVYLLANHITKAMADDYLFSADNFLPGSVKLNPDSITKRWSKMRGKIQIDSKYKWYGLKDTGITDLIIAGVNLRSVRDQARHHSIKQTEDYIPRSLKKADAYILNSGIKFND